MTGRRSHEPLTSDRFLEAFRGFFDDAAIYPPGNASLHDAISAYRERRATPWAELTGPLVLGLGELRAARLLAGAHSDEPVRVSLVAPAAEVDSARAASSAVAPDLDVVGLELKASGPRERWIREIDDVAGTGLPVFLEFTSNQIEAGALAQLAGTGVRLKFRTGGMSAELFPSAASLAMVVYEAVAAGVPFKLTAGLHQAVHHTDARTGWVHHGFLNVALATERASMGASRRELETILLDEDGAAIAGSFVGLTAGWREQFLTIGTCSIAEPMASLAELGVSGPAYTPPTTVSRNSL